jgi:hypothetical protein
MGVIRSEDRPKTIDASYQLAENLQPSERVREFFKNRIRKAISKVIASGVDGLIEAVDEDSTQARSLLDLLAVLDARYGVCIDPMAFPYIQGEVKRMKGRKLYQAGQTGELKGRNFTIFMDHNVARGHCVVSDSYAKEEGVEIAVWRNPIILSTGLLVLKSAKPQLHHLGSRNAEGDRVVPEYIMYLNPLDCADMQGDDDGDQVAATKDPEVVVLFREERICTERYVIEPPKDSKKRDIRSASPEGIAYVAFDHRGPVGIPANARAKLLAVGTPKCVELATLMSVLAQECVDMNKRDTPFAILESFDEETKRWTRNVTWVASTDEGGPTNRLVAIDGGPVPRQAPGCPFPFEDVARYVNHTLELSGVEGADAAFWYRKEKLIDSNEWSPEALAHWTEFWAGRSPGNTVHNGLAAMQAWNEFRGAELLRLEPAEGNPAQLILQGCREAGMKVPTATSITPEVISRFDASHLGRGIHEYNAAMKALKGMAFDDSIEARANARASLVESFDTLVTERNADPISVWLWWLAVEDAIASQNDAAWAKVQNGDRRAHGAKHSRQAAPSLPWLVASSVGSQINRVLTAGKSTCTWMDQSDIASVFNDAVRKALGEKDPVGVMLEMINEDTTHSESTGVALFHCEECQDKIWRSLVCSKRAMGTFMPKATTETLDAALGAESIGGQVWDRLHFLSVMEVREPLDVWGKRDKNRKPILSASGKQTHYSYAGVPVIPLTTAEVQQRREAAKTQPNKLSGLPD